MKDIVYSSDSYRICTPKETVKNTINKMKKIWLYQREEITMVDAWDYDILWWNVIWVKWNSELSMWKEYSWGKWFTVEEAFAWAIMEWVERFSLNEYKKEWKLKSTFNNLEDKNKISFWQLIKDEWFTVRGFDKEEYYKNIENNTIDDIEFEWIKAECLNDNKTYTFPYYKKEFWSNWICTWNNKNEALLHWIWELVERHVQNVIMANLIDPKLIDISELKNPELLKVIDEIKSKWFEVYFLDFTMWFACTTISVIAYNEQFQIADYCYMNWHAWTCLDKDIAFVRTLSELIQNRSTHVYLQWQWPLDKNWDYKVPETQPTTKIMNYYLDKLRKGDYETIKYNELNNLSTKDSQKDLEITIKDLKSKWYNIYIIDTWYKDLDIPVYKIIIPWLQWTLFEEWEFINESKFRITEKHINLDKINELIYNK